VPRPSVEHSGFLVPNARDLADPAMAEPDQIDFNTIANARWGVIEGCEVQIDRQSARTVGGTALIDGQLVTVKDGGVTLSNGGVQDRFDLVVTDTDGTLKTIEGTPSNDPVFPDVPPDRTLLAAVFCGAGGSDFSNNVIDKRKFIADSLRTKIPSTDNLIINRNGSTNLYQVNGEGYTTWNGDATLRRKEFGVLEITRDLEVFNKLTAGGVFSAASVTARSGPVIGTNLRRGDVPDPATGTIGDLFQSTTTGLVYSRTAEGWVQLVAGDSVTPYGTVIYSLRPRDEMEPLGWLPLMGQEIVESNQNKRLFDIPFLRSQATGTVGSRRVRLPNMSQRFPKADFATPGTVGGSSTITVGMVNMPTHQHDVNAAKGGQTRITGSTTPAGGHRHEVVTFGRHGHEIDEGEGHMHPGMAAPGGGIITEVAGGLNSIDAFFNDRSHTYEVASYLWIARARTNLRVTMEGSAHDHTISPVDDHSHKVDVTDVPAHDHVITQETRGEGRPINYSPPFITMFCYIKT
jgi:microcystin-dependent protein